MAYRICASGVVTLSRNMRRLNEKLDELRRSLGYTYDDVHEKLEQRGINVTPAAVGHWFNGTRTPRSMKSLSALCAILETTLDAITNDEIEVADDAREMMMLKQFRAMSADQQSAMLALAATMTSAVYPAINPEPPDRHTINEPNPRR